MITSSNNQQMKQIIQLNKKGKVRREQQLFVVEGWKMFLEAPKERIEKVYVSHTFYKEQGEQLKNIPYEIVADAVFNSVADTQTPQGILCLIRMHTYEWKDVLDGNDTHLLILESIQDPGNLGTMLRTGEGAGVSGVIMNKTTVDIFNPKTIRSTMGSIYRVPFLYVDDLKSSIEKLKSEVITIYGAHLEGTISYDAFDYKRPVGFLIGNEGNGLSDEISSCAQEYLRIPMHGQVESLNAAVAATILMYEVNRQRR